jgi:hypothetical protein
MLRIINYKSVVKIKISGCYFNLFSIGAFIIKVASKIIFKAYSSTHGLAPPFTLADIHY